MRYILTLFVLLISAICQAATPHMLDNRAKSAPVFETPSKLVEHLLKGVSRDEEKARVLAAWIVYHIDRDGFHHKEMIKYSNQNRKAPENSKNNSFKTYIGTSQDFAKLFSTLCQTAGLESKIIDGYAGHDIQAFRYKNALGQSAEVLMNALSDNNSYYLQKYRSSWNAVMINGEWKLIDTYWMIANENLYEAKNIRSEAAFKHFLAQREDSPPRKETLLKGKKIKEEYFLADPHEFIKTHFPLDSEWQLLKLPKTFESFLTEN